MKAYMEHFINQLDILPFSLSNIYEQMNLNNFGRLIAYLTLVYKIADSLDEETTRDAVRRTVEAFKLIDLGKYKVKPSWFNWLTQPFYKAVVMYVERF